MAGETTPEEALESLKILSPAYFADFENAPPMPPVRMSVEAYSGILAEVTAGTDEVAAALAAGEVPYGVIALRKRELEVSKADLERIDAGDARELAALQTSLRLAQEEIAILAARNTRGRDQLRRWLQRVLRTLRRSWSGT